LKDRLAAAPCVSGLLKEEAGGDMTTSEDEAVGLKDKSAPQGTDCYGLWDFSLLIAGCLLPVRH